MEAVEFWGDMLVGVEQASMQMRAARATKCWVMGARASLPAARGDAGGRRSCQSHVNLQFSCSFFLQGEGTPNGRLRERAGRLDAWGALDRLVPCAEIAIADGNCWRFAAQQIIAGIGSSKPVAAVPEVSAISPRY
jgi:hypothetical protein